MYRPEELLNIVEKPRINDISLEVLQQFYTMFLRPFVYCYEITDGDIKSRVELAFDKDKFCHLLGVETVAKNAVSHADLVKYKGLQGWEEIENGNLTFKELKVLNKKKFNDIKAKYVFFYALPNILEQPLAVRFNPQDVNPPVRIQSELLFYNQIDNAVVHLGIDKADNERCYYPRSFFVEKLKDDNIDIYTVNQQSIRAEKIDRMILLGE